MKISRNVAICHIYGIFSSVCKTISRDINDVLMNYLSYLDSFQVNPIRLIDQMNRRWRFDRFLPILQICVQTPCNQFQSCAFKIARLCFLFETNYQLIKTVISNAQIVVMIKYK